MAAWAAGCPGRQVSASARMPGTQIPADAPAGAGGRRRLTQALTQQGRRWGEEGVPERRPCPGAPFPGPVPECPSVPGKGGFFLPDPSHFLRWSMASELGARPAWALKELLHRVHRDQARPRSPQCHSHSHVFHVSLPGFLLSVGSLRGRWAPGPMRGPGTPHKRGRHHPAPGSSVHS